MWPFTYMFKSKHRKPDFRVRFFFAHLAEYDRLLHSPRLLTGSPQNTHNKRKLPVIRVVQGGCESVLVNRKVESMMRNLHDTPFYKTGDLFHLDQQ